MIATIKGEASVIDAPYGTYYITPQFLRIYENFNQKVFNSVIMTLPEFTPFINAVYDIHKQKRPEYIFDSDWMIGGDMQLLKNNKDVLLGFSGGLDSCYFAIALKEQGYNVHLLHIRNLNGYEGNLSYKTSVEFAKKMNMELIVCKFKRRGGKDNKYAQFWEDNTSKNQLIYTIMIDICLQRGWQTIALGDDRSMSSDRPDMTLGINSTDCREVQDAYEESITKIIPNVRFLLIDRKVNSTETNKYDRLYKLSQYGVLDSYYSCVGAGRFNQYNHTMNESKFGIKLPQYNCGCSCTKCAIHNLLLHYKGFITYPSSFVDKCWERLWNTKHGTIKALFAPNIPLQDRIDNLFKY